MQYRLVRRIGEVYFMHLHIAGQACIGQAAVLMRMLPGPHARTLTGLNNLAVLFLCIDECHISLILLGLFIHQAEDTFGTGQGHGDEVDLL